MPAQSISANVPEELLRQRQLVNALRVHGYFLRHPRVEETHISWVLLTGHDAYKIKKSVDLGFLDFSTLEQRRFFCNEELRLNRRLAPALYLGIVAIGGSVEHPVFGGEPVIEYAVHMRRFAQSSMMNRMLSRGGVTLEHIDKLAAVIARFHSSLPPAAAGSPFCSTTGIQKAAVQNFDQLPRLLTRPDDLVILETVRKASALEFTSCEPLFRLRASAGRVRECHGDLHLGNIALLDDIPTPFDCVEFNASLRWIDVISEISFPVMDLLRRGQSRLAWRLLNAYLEITGDFSGVGVLRFYLGYRAMVRAKIAAIRAVQRGAAGVGKELKSFLSYIRLAHSCLTCRRPVLIITHGLPGCGKSTFAQIALERLGAIRIRSDVERKRMFGLGPLDDSKAQTGADVYSEDATRKTYARLKELARELLSAGFPVVVDAAFVLHTEREGFHALAQEMDVPFVIASLQTDVTVMEKRLRQRSILHTDASEADIQVLRKLQLVQAPLLDEELVNTVTFSNNNDIDALRSEHKGWKQLDTHLAR